MLVNSEITTKKIKEFMKNHVSQIDDTPTKVLVSDCLFTLLYKIRQIEKKRKQVRKSLC